MDLNEWIANVLTGNDMLGIILVVGVAVLLGGIVAWSRYRAEA